MRVTQVFARRRGAQLRDFAAFKVVPPAGYGIRRVPVLTGSQKRRGHQQEKRDFSRSPAYCRCRGLPAVPWDHCAVPAVFRMSKRRGD